jgi:hypothetical protein
VSASYADTLLAGVVTLVLAVTSAGVRAPIVRAMGAAPPSAEAARVRIAAALVDEVIRSFLPVTLSMAPPAGPAGDGGVAPATIPASLTELGYCGPGAEGSGRFRAVIRLAGVPARSAPPLPGLGRLLGAGDCRHGLGELGRRLATDLGKDDGAVVLADLEATWRPWELRLTVARFVSLDPPRAAGFGEARRDLLAFSTAGLTVPTDFGVLVFHAAPVFATDGIEVAAILGELGASPPTTRPVATGSATAISADAGGNVTLDLPYTLVNNLLRIFTAGKPLPVRVGGDTVDVRNVSLAATGGGGIAIAGMATSRAVPESGRVTVTAGGGDLQVATIRVDPQLENCGGLGGFASLACNARNAGRAGAAAALGATATDRYQSQLVRELAGPQELRCGVARHDLRLGAELQRIAAGARGLSVSARLAPREPVGTTP